MTPRIVLRLGALAVASIAAVAPAAYAQAPDRAPHLFRDGTTAARGADARAAASGMDGIRARRTVRESRMVEIDASLLEGAHADARGAITLNVFPGVDLPVTFERLERRGRNHVLWRGRVGGDHPGSATIVVKDGKVTGAIRAGRDTFMIEALGGGRHAVTRLDHSQYPPDHPPMPARDGNPLLDGAGTSLPPPAPLSGARDLTAALCTALGQQDCLTEIKVVVAYTSAANQRSGGNVANLIDIAVAEANQSYRNSGVNIQLTLAHKYQTAYRESSWTNDLNRFRTAGDRYMEEVHARRVQYAADVAVLVLHNTTACGLASSILAGKASAFAAVHWDCATGYYSFAHEIGHLQGARHNPEADPSIAPYAHGHGYVFPFGSWRTIMAYADNRCPDGSCTRVQYWSNPNVVYPCGTNAAACAPMGTAASHDNARVLNDTSGLISGFIP